MAQVTDEQIQAYLALTGYREDQKPLEKKYRLSKVDEEKIQEAIAHGFI